MSISAAHGATKANRQFYEEGPNIFTYEVPPKINLLTFADNGKEMRFIWWGTEKRGGSADFDYTKERGLWLNIHFDPCDFNENDALKIAKSFKFVEIENVIDSALAKDQDFNYSEVKPI
jgi:hypothetical protein